jgi:N-sulfoglucosamine sulfohydrolase
MLNLLRLILLACFACLAAHAAERPNILWITSEDNGRYLGCYGDKNANTPALDALAAKGVRFTKCFTHAPVCALSRGSLILGLHSSSVGAQGMRSDYRIPPTFITYPTALREAGYYATNNAKTDYNSSSIKNETWDESGKKAHYKNRQAGQPFFAVFNIELSHEGQIFESHYPKNYKNPDAISERIEIPPYQVKTPENLLDWQRMYDRIHDMDTKVAKLLEELQVSGDAENTIVVYCSDHSGITSRSKRYLYDTGTRVPLIVYVPEKWKSWSAGISGSANDRLVQFTDLPKTFLTIAQAKIPSTMTGTVFLGAKPEPAPTSVFLFSGRFDEAPDMRRGLADGRWKYIRNYEPDRNRFQILGFPWQQYGLRSQWREFQAGRTNPLQSAYFLTQVPEELYDTQVDPHEVNNLATDPASREMLDQLRAELDRHILTTHDLGFMPEVLVESVDQSSESTVHEYGRSKENYPLPEILKLANIASAKDPGNLQLLSDNLTNKNPVMRYWAALGLRVLGSAAKPAETALAKSMDDPDPSTRITAMIAYGNLGADERRSSLLKLIAEAENARDDIHALWVIDAIKLLHASDSVKDLPAKTFTKGSYSKKAIQHLQAGGVEKMASPD